MNNPVQSNTTQLMILLRCILTLFLSATFFGSSHEPSSGLLLFLVRQNIQLAVVIVNVILYLLRPNDIYMCRIAALTSRRYILNIYSTNLHTEYFKHAA